jgi:hypothetical protein
MKKMSREISVKAHPRKGTKGVKRHTRSASGKNKVPSRGKKVPIVDIELTKAEGTHRDPYLNVVVHNRDFKEANRTMSQMALWTPRSGATDKVDYDIKFADGSIYRGTIKLDKEYNHAGNGFRKHVKQNLSIASGVKPAHFTEKEWKQWQKFTKMTPTSKRRARAKMDKFGFD